MGKSHVIEEPGELESAHSLSITPWAGGERETYVRIVPRKITGRRIRKQFGDA